MKGKQNKSQAKVKAALNVPLELVAESLGYQMLRAYAEARGLPNSERKARLLQRLEIVKEIVTKR